MQCRWVQRASMVAPGEVQQLDWKQLDQGWQLLPVTGSNPHDMPALFDELSTRQHASHDSLAPSATAMINVRFLPIYYLPSVQICGWLFFTYCVVDGPTWGVHTS